MPQSTFFIILALVIAALACQAPRKRYRIIEGATGNSYEDPGLKNDPQYQAMRNAAAIAELHDQVKDYGNLMEELVDLSGNVHKTAQAVQAMNKQLDKCQQGGT